MDPGQFLVEFNRIASAPNGAEHLRQLVMGLALSGDLLTNGGELPDNFSSVIKEARQKYYDDLGGKA